METKAKVPRKQETLIDRHGRLHKAVVGQHGIAPFHAQVPQLALGGRAAVGKWGTRSGEWAGEGRIVIRWVCGLVESPGVLQGIAVANWPQAKVNRSNQMKGTERAQNI